MPLSNYALDNYVSQNITQLTECNAVDLSNIFDQADFWINNFVLNSIFRTQVKQEFKPFIFAILRRAQMALIEHENGRRSLQDFVNGNKNRVSIYFRSLYHFETAFSLTYQAYDIFMELTGEKFFEKNDGSPLQRLNQIYNVSRHFTKSDIHSSHLHVVWLSNEGVHISSTVLTFEELSDLIKDICRLAKKLSSIPDTKKEAENAAREMLRNQGGGELTTMGRDHKIRSKDTIAPGNDPCPPRDKEH